MTTPLEALAIIAPQFAAIPQAAGAIALASEQVRQDHCFYTSVVANLAAHMLTVASQLGTAGAVTSKREGDLAITFAAPATGTGANGLAGTAYGQEVDRLNRLCYGLSARFAFEAILDTEPLLPGALQWPES